MFRKILIFSAFLMGVGMREPFWILLALVDLIFKTSLVKWCLIIVTFPFWWPFSLWRNRRKRRVERKKECAECREIYYFID